MTRTPTPARQRRSLVPGCRLRLSISVFLFLLAVSCSRPEVPVSIQFDAVFDDVSINCASTPHTLTDLRFYVSNLALIRSDGRPEIVHLHADDAWQNERLSMIDLESGGGACRNGTADTNDTIAGFVQGGDYVGLRFTIGVPFELNHGNPLLAVAPLDDSAMHWHWRSGYKFLRAGVRRTDAQAWLHLGSTGCEGTVGNISACVAPNRVVIELPDFDAGNDIVTIDLAQLLTLDQATGGEPGSCLSSPAEDACSSPFAALGLPFADENAGKQQVFGVSP